MMKRKGGDVCLFYVAVVKGWFRGGGGDVLKMMW